MMKWFLFLALLLGLFGYAIIQHDSLLRWQLARVVQEEGISTGDDFLRFKYNGDPRPYLNRFSDGIVWRRHLCTWAYALGDYKFVEDAAKPAVEAHKDGPLANNEDLISLEWLNAQALEMDGQFDVAKASYREILDLHPDFPQKDEAKQRYDGLNLYH